MKRVVSIFLCVLLANVTYAQLTKSQEGYIEKKIAEAEAKAKKEREAKERKEREERIKTEQRHEQQRRLHEANYKRQMENLNQVSASDFINSPQQQGGNFSTKVNKFREDQLTPDVVAIPKKENTNRPNGDPFGNSGRIGSPSYSGLNYTGNRYDNKRAGFDNAKLHQQVRVPTNHYRQKYPSQRPVGNQKVVSMYRTKGSPKVAVLAFTQQGHVQSAKEVQTQPEQQTSVQRKVARVVNGKIHLDTSRSIVIQPQSASSADLSPVDTRRIDYATKVNNIAVYTLPDEAYQLSDRDDKITSGNVKGLANDERTLAKQVQLMREDAMNGFSSIENRQKWEYIYGYGYARDIKIPSRSATQKRK